MKKLLVILVIGILLTGCENKTSKVEVVPNLEAIYTSVNDVDIPPKESKETSNDTNKDLVEAAKSLYSNKVKGSEKFKIAIRIYLNETGTIDKIKDISNPADKIESNTDSIKIFADNEKLINAIADRITKWKFEPAKIDNTPVKCWTDLKLDIIIKPDGSYNIELPGFFDDFNFFNSNETYLSSAQKMPDLIGGIEGLQQRIKYPEIARQRGIQGKVFIVAYINEEGKVTKAKVLKGIGGGCDEAALNAVKESRFTPGENNGKPVKVQVTIPLFFKLSEN